MAQPAFLINDEMTDLSGLPIHWTKSSLSSPISWDNWLGQFSLGLDKKDNFNVSDINVAPSAAHKDPPQRPETKPDTEAQTEADNRLRRDAAALRRVEETFNIRFVGNK